VGVSILRPAGATGSSVSPFVEVSPTFVLAFLTAFFVVFFLVFFFARAFAFVTFTFSAVSTAEEDVALSSLNHSAMVASRPAEIADM
jgi:hypothetical protein